LRDAIARKEKKKSLFFGNCYHFFSFNNTYMAGLSINDIQAAAARIQVHTTPVVTSTILDALAGSEQHPRHLLFKCELLQKSGCE
jgi:hypothetical protein